MTTESRPLSVFFDPDLAAALQVHHLTAHDLTDDEARALAELFQQELARGGGSTRGEVAQSLVEAFLEGEADLGSVARTETGAA